MAEPWWASSLYPYLAVGLALFGSAFGGLAGILISRGVAKPIVRTMFAVEAVVGIGMLAAGVYAFLSGQPWSICFTLGFTGLMYAGTCGPFFFLTDRLYRHVEERRLAAELLRRS